MERLKNHHKRIIHLLLWCSLCVIAAFNDTATAQAEKNSVLQWTAADLLPAESRYSILRYGAFGLGAYPQRINFPGAAVKVRFDGVPLYALSPFGPDLDCVPVAFVDSVSYGSRGGISIHSPEIDSDVPITNTNFLLGQKRRFRIQATFRKKTGDSGSIFFGGSSNGIHGGDYTETTSFRNYLMKYQRTLKDGGRMYFSIRAFRDRDGLRDLTNKTHMGERETDIITLTSGVHAIPLTERTSISPAVYYQSGISHFKRYGASKSLDDDAIGFSLTSSTVRGNTGLDLTVHSDSRFIDSRLHEDTWTNNDSRISGSWRWADNSLRYVVRGGIVRSSTYGTGGNGESELVYSVTPSIELSVRGSVADEVPDIGLEFYPSLEFSDTTATSDLDMYRIMEFESGLKVNRGILMSGLYAFRVHGKHPLFNPLQSLSTMADKETCSGFRFFMNVHEEGRYQADISLHYRNSSKTENIWPNPVFDMVSYSQISKKFIHDRLDTSLFCTMNLSDWSDGQVTPDGTFFFLDGGISVKVLSLTMFYMIENITGNEAEWFDTLNWQGRNSMWGVQWRIEN